MTTVSRLKGGDWLIVNKPTVRQRLTFGVKYQQLIIRFVIVMISQTAITPTKCSHELCISDVLSSIDILVHVLSVRGQ